MKQIPDKTLFFPRDYGPPFTGRLRFEAVAYAVPRTNLFAASVLLNSEPTAIELNEIRHLFEQVADEAERKAIDALNTSARQCVR